MLWRPVAFFYRKYIIAASNWNLWQQFSSDRSHLAFHIHESATRKIHQRISIQHASHIFIPISQILHQVLTYFRSKRLSTKQLCLWSISLFPYSTIAVFSIPCFTVSPHKVGIICCTAYLHRYLTPHLPIMLLTWALPHTEVSSSQTVVRIGHHLQQVGVIECSWGTLGHTCATVFRVFTSLRRRNCFMILNREWNFSRNSCFSRLACVRVHSTTNDTTIAAHCNQL